MWLLNQLLKLILRIACAYPRTVIVLFCAFAMAGFYLLPSITISTDLIAGVEHTNPVIKLTSDNHRVFGEQDSLILVLDFPEPPGEARRPFIEGLGKALEQIPGVRRVLYRFLDPDDEKQVSGLLQNFLRGMNDRELWAIRALLSPQGITEALRRTRNRLFLVENPYVQQRILEDPVELGRLLAESFSQRVGKVSFGDIYLFLASPDSTMYMIQITPDFNSSNIAKGKELLSALRESIPQEIKRLTDAIPGAQKKFRGLKWYLTGKTEFHYETDVIFDHEVLRMLLVAFALVSGFLIYVYRSLKAVGILMAPILVAVGGNYVFVYLAYDAINPVVMGSAGILFGLGTDFGVHLWGRLKEEMDSGQDLDQALGTVFDRTGPPATLGALTSVIAFLCLYISEQPAMGQFGFVCASGVLMALAASLFLVPAWATLMGRKGTQAFPRMTVSFKRFSSLFMSKPRAIAIAFPLVVTVSLLFSLRLSYEEDLMKVFMARGLNSMAVAEKLAERFKSNFSQPTLLSFDIGNPDQGVMIQRRLDAILEALMESEGEIATFDSISYLCAPASVQRHNIRALSDIVGSWQQLENVFKQRLAVSDFSEAAAAAMFDSFRKTGRLIKELKVVNPTSSSDDGRNMERSWYLAKIYGKYRFLTKVRYAETVKDPESLKQADTRLMAALEGLPAEVHISGPRQSMEALLAGLVSELLRLGILAVFCVVLFFFMVFRNPLGVGLSLLPMIGAFCVTLGIMGAAGVGIPFSIIGVAPLIFGLGIDNGIHVVMRSSDKTEGSVKKVMAHMAPLVIVTSVTTVLGFASMINSRHYSLEFLGWAMVIGMATALALTVIALPALLLLLESRSSSVTDTP